MSTILNIESNLRVVNIAVPLDTTGVLTYKFGTNGDNSLSDFVMNKLFSFIRNDELSKLFAGLSKARKERKSSFIYVVSEKEFGMANALITNVKSEEECTIMTQCLYTDDSNFDVSRITSRPVTNEFFLDRVAQGKTCYISPNKTYVFKLVSERYVGTFTERITDYVFYLPNSSLR